MLMDETVSLSSQQRVDRAFRNDTQKEIESDKVVHAQNMELFHSYVLGGIEELYGQFTSGGIDREDYINKIYDITVSFKE